MSSHQLNSAFTAASIGSATGTGRAAARYTPRMIDFTPDPVADPARPDHHRLVRARLRARPGGRLRGHRPAGRAGPAIDAEILANGMIVVAIAALIGGRLYHVIDQWALYQDDLSRSSCRPTRASASTAGSPGTIAGVPLRPLEAAPVPALGATSSSPGLFVDAGASRAGATSSTRSCTARRPTCRGASRSTAPIASPTYPCSAYPTRRRRASTRCSCTSRSRASSGALSCSGSAPRCGRGCGPATCSSIFFIWYGVVRFVLETAAARTTGRSSGSRSRRSCRCVFVIPSLVDPRLAPSPGPPRRTTPTIPAEGATWGALGRGRAGRG